MNVYENVTWTGNTTTVPNTIWQVGGGGGYNVMPPGNWGLGAIPQATYSNTAYVDQAALAKVTERLKLIEDRLAIITDPDPEKLGKYAALRLAYENYKMLERLCIDTESPDET